jgi:ORF6N domain
VSAKSLALLPVEQITCAILVLRGQRVLLDAELAALYGVITKRLNEQVKRNAERFPEDFLFQLSAAEVETLNRSQIGMRRVKDVLTDRRTPCTRPSAPPRAVTP